MNELITAEFEMQQLSRRFTALLPKTQSEPTMSEITPEAAEIIDSLTTVFRKVLTEHCAELTPRSSEQPGGITAEDVRGIATSDMEQSEIWSKILWWAGIQPPEGEE